MIRIKQMMMRRRRLIDKMNAKTLIPDQIDHKIPSSCEFPLPPSVPWLWDIRNTLNDEIEVAKGLLAFQTNTDRELPQ